MIKEANSPYYVFLDETDDKHHTYIQHLILKWTEPKKNAPVMACKSKYFRSCLTLITSLFKYSEYKKSRIHTDGRNIKLYTRCKV